MQRIWAFISNGNQAMDRHPRGMNKGFGRRPWSKVSDRVAGPLLERGVIFEINLPWGRDNLHTPMTYEAGPARLADDRLAEAYSTWDEAWEPVVKQYRTDDTPWPVGAYLGTMPRSPRINTALAEGDYRGAYYWLTQGVQQLVASGVRIGFDAPFIDVGRRPLPEDHWSVHFIKTLRGMGLDPYLEGPPFDGQWDDLDFDWRTNTLLGGHARARVPNDRYIVAWIGQVTGGTRRRLDSETELQWLIRQARDLAPHWQQGRSVMFHRADLLARVTDEQMDDLREILATA